MKLLCLFFLLALPVAANAQWGADTKLSTNEVSAGLNETMGQSIVTSGSTVHVIWYDSGIGTGVVVYKRSLDGGSTWGPDTELTGTSASFSNPLIAVSGSYVHVAYMGKTGTIPTSYYMRSIDGGTTWGAPISFGTSTYWPGVACSGSMVYMTLNNRVSPTNTEIYFFRSTNNGSTWGAEQQISNADGRSEDPAMYALGNNVQLVWNDNRNTLPPATGMAVYYRRSADAGVTWGPETALTQAPAYTYFPTIWLSGSNVDVPYGDRQTGHYDIYYQHSADLGTTWYAAQQITNTPSTDEFYPVALRDGLNVHLVWTSSAGVVYQHSSNGGASWDPSVVLTSQGSNAFMAVAGQKLYVIFRSARDGHGAIYYKINPTGNPTQSNGVPAASAKWLTVLGVGLALAGMVFLKRMGGVGIKRT